MHAFCAVTETFKRQHLRETVKDRERFRFLFWHISYWNRKVGWDISRDLSNIYVLTWTPVVNVLNNICEPWFDPSREHFIRQKTMASNIFGLFLKRLFKNLKQWWTSVNWTRTLLKQTHSNQRNTVNMKNNNVILGFARIKRKISKPDYLIFNPGLLVYISMNSVKPGLLNPGLNKPKCENPTVETSKAVTITDTEKDT